MNDAPATSPYPPSELQHSALSETADNATWDVQCQGCGAIRAGSWLGKGHACWRNEDGTYEEGGTFQ